MIFIKGGCFQMGDVFNIGDYDERPVHNVCVDDFFLGKHEVTNEEFERFVKETGYKTTVEMRGVGWGVSKQGASDWDFRKGINWLHPLWPSDEITGRRDHPVVQVSWDDAQAYTEWLTNKSGKEYRLPTEAEWEFAARSGGKKYKYSWGDRDPSANVADETARKKFSGWSVWDGYDDGYVYTSPVGKFRPNEMGLFDMMGNVWEWVHDWYDEEYYRRSSKNNPMGPGGGELHVLRGGSWVSGPEDVRVSLRFWGNAGKAEDNIGFRVARSAK